MLGETNKSADYSTLAIAEVSSFLDCFVVAESSVLPTYCCAKKFAHLQSVKC